MEDKPKINTTYFDYHPGWLRQFIEVNFPELVRPKHKPPYHFDAEERPKIKQKTIDKERSESMEKGKVVFFNKEKGFGFIKVEGREKDVFAHAKEIEDEVKSLERGQSVEFVAVETEKGPEARNIKVLEDVK